MTAKEKMYKKAHDKVVRLMKEKGYSLTTARTEVAVAVGLSYNTVIRITLDLSPTPTTSPKRLACKASSTLPTPTTSPNTLSRSCVGKTTI